MPRYVSDDSLIDAVNAVAKHGSIREAAKALKVPASTVQSRLLIAKRRGLSEPSPEPDELDEPSGSMSLTGKRDYQVLTLRTTTVRTLEGALATSEVDLKTWEVERWVCNKWDVVCKIDVVTADDDNILAATELWQVKVWFKRISPLARTIINLIDELAEASPIVPAFRVKEPLLTSHRRALELCLMDPHLGMHCFKPGSDHAWSLDDCEDTYMWALENLIEASKPYWPIAEIVIPMGNDLYHVDNMQHTTTGNTPQPEAVTFYEMYERGMKLCIAAIERVKQIAPVKVKIIQGNHDRQTTFTLGHVLWGYFHNDANVHVDASANPYKFYNFGTNLIGYDHGHSVAQVRLAALMANEVPDLWAKTSYREWHCGDQHRKGSSKPTAFEEQGVSVEFLPGLTPPNEWHRLKSYNWQKRGAMGYVWDYDCGPIARLQCNINSYSGRPTGEKKQQSYD